MNVEEAEKEVLKVSRAKVIIGLAAILSRPAYDPTVEGPALLETAKEMDKAGHLSLLGAIVSLGSGNSRDFLAELRELVTKLFPLGVEPTPVIVPDYVEAHDANRLYGESFGYDWVYEGKSAHFSGPITEAGVTIDGQEDPPGDVNNPDLYAQAAPKIFDAPLNEGDRVTGKPEALAAPYGESPAPYTELQFTTDYNAILDYAHGAGIILSCAKQNELRIVLRGVLETGKPAKFEPGNGDVLVLGAKASDHKEFAEFAVAAKRDHHLGLLLKRLLN